MKTRTRFVLAGVILSAAVTALTASQSSKQPGVWPEWRGPGRRAIVSSTQVPAAWPASFNKTWTVTVGEGYSSPVVVGGVAFVHSRQDPQEVVTAVDVASGKVKWRQTYPAPINKNSYAVQMGKGPNATPLVAGGRLFTVGASGHVHAFDAESGKSLWTRDFSGIVNTTKLFCGTAASPILANGLVVVQAGSDVHGGIVAGLDPATGAVRWETKGDGPGYASPILIDVAGGQQLVTMTNRSIIGLDAKGGKLLWTLPFTDEWHENIVTPLWTGQELIVSGVRQGTRALALKPGAAPAELWKNAEVTMYMSSPVAADGLIYGFSSKRKGQFVALDLKTGAVKWASEGREGEQASILLAPKHVLFLTNTGALVVVGRTAAGFTEVKRYDISESQTWTLPVFLGSAVIVREATNITRLDAK
jgi:outer membrane protein assembly factor BamB